MPDTTPKVVLPRKTLTDRSLQALKPAPAGKRVTKWDPMMPGLAIRVTDKGKRSFYAVRRRAGQPQPTWVLLGAYPVMTLGEARAAAREALGALMKGDDPATIAESKRQAKAEVERKREATTFRAIAEEFISKHLPRLRSARAGEALIRRELIPVLGDKTIGEIRRRDVIALLEAIVERGARERELGRARPRSGGEHAALHTLASLRKLFNWALARDIEGLEEKNNPCGRVEKANLFADDTRKPRARVLSDAELRIVWRAAKATPYPFGDLIRALILTGQRLRELSDARRSEIDGSMLLVPAERMKGKVAHVVPLTGRIQALLKALPRFEGGEYLFTTTGGRRPISGFSKMKARFDRTVAEIVARDRAALVAAGATEAEATECVRGVEHWALHDLRRSMRTGVAAAGVLVFIAELVIAHRQKGVHAVYDLHRYDAEKREALERWEKRLISIVEPPPGNVVDLPARATA